MEPLTSCKFQHPVWLFLQALPRSLLPILFVMPLGGCFTTENSHLHLNYSYLQAILLYLKNRGYTLTNKTYTRFQCSCLSAGKGYVASITTSSNFHHRHTDARTIYHLGFRFRFSGYDFTTLFTLNRKQPACKVEYQRSYHLPLWYAVLAMLILYGKGNSPLISAIKFSFLMKWLLFVPLTKRNLPQNVAHTRDPSAARG